MLKYEGSKSTTATGHGSPQEPIILRGSSWGRSVIAVNQTLATISRHQAKDEYEEATMTAFEITNVKAWAAKLAGDKFGTVVLRVGQPYGTDSHWNGGYGSGTEAAIQRVEYPSTEWVDEGNAVTYKASGANEGSWSGHPVNTPTLLKIRSTDRSAGVDERRTWQSHSDTGCLLLIPMGETEEAYQKGLRREFASSVRTQLEQNGYHPTLIKQLFDACGIGNAINASQLAERATAAVGNNACQLLNEVLHAPYGWRHRLTILQEKFHINWTIPRHGRFDAFLQGAVAVLGGNPSEKPASALVPAEWDGEKYTIATIAATPEPTAPCTDMEEGLAILLERFGLERRR